MTMSPLLAPSRLLTCLLGLSACTAALAEGIPSQLLDYFVDSGTLDNPTDEPRVVFETLIEAPEGTPWIQLAFGAAHLAPGSYLVTTSLLDGEWQPLNAEHLAQWQMHTCFFNGSAVWLELVAGPHTTGNFVRLEQIHVGLVENGDDSNGDEDLLSICDRLDERTPITFPAVGRLLVHDPRDVRLLTGGCTGFIIDEPVDGNDKCHLSAGHCFTRGSRAWQRSTIFQFNVPASRRNCALQHPPVEKQFAIKSFEAVNNGFGDDWAVFKCHPNPKTSRTTFQEQQMALKRAAGPPRKNAVTAVAGYGLDGSDNNFDPKNCRCVPGDGTGTRNQTLQLAFGIVTDVAATSLTYTVDTCPANSGSPVGNPRDRTVYAIHESGGCRGNVNDNGGTRCDARSGRRALLDAIRKCAGAREGDIDGDGVVGLPDLALLLGEWNRCADPDSDPPYSPLADLDGDGCVGMEDLAILLTNYNAN